MKPLIIACCTMVLACAVFLTVGAGAQTAILANSQYVTFGMVGLSSSQTARLNAFGLPTGGPIIAGASCGVTFDFYDATGKSLKTGSTTVAQGDAVNFDLAWTDITAPTSNTTTNRVEIRGTVRAGLVSTSTGGTPVTPVAGSCSVLPTLEIFDTATGQTTLVLQQTTALSQVIPL